MHEGHRKRMLERLESGGALHDHELLEILLFNAIRRKNTNGIAHNLLKAFGSMDGVFHASYDQLLTVEGVGPETAAYLRCVAICGDRIRFTDSAFPEKIDFETYSAFLTARFSGLANEFVEVYAVDASERVRSTKRFYSNDAKKAAVDLDELSRFIATHSPHGILIAHNHPQETSKPSAQDDKFTKQIAMLCSFMNVKFLDHCIVGSDGCFSYFRNARLDRFKAECSVNSILNGEERR